MNDTRGFEHGFTVRERPVGGGDVSEELTLQLRVRGDLAPQVQDGRRGVAFVDTQGSPVLNYSGLTVFDADCKTLHSWFELAPEGLRLSVDESEARYPLTIDPIAQQVYLEASNTDMNDFFGLPVAISNDTLVVGAPIEHSNAIGVDGNQGFGSPGSGAAYVFDLDAPEPPPANLCNGDGGDQLGCTNCPCGNNAVPGTVGGCLNSAGTSARLSASGNKVASSPDRHATSKRYIVNTQR